MKPYETIVVFVAALSLTAAGCSTSGAKQTSSTGYRSATANQQTTVKVHHHGQSAAMGSAGTMAQSSSSLDASEDELSILLHEEELQVGKRTVSNGGVVLRKTVKTETVEREQPLKLQREEYVIERVSGEEVNSLPHTTAAFEDQEIFLDDQEIFIPLYREVPSIEKKTTVAEWVQVDKVIETDREVVSRPVRKESIEIVRHEPETSEALAAKPASEEPAVGAPGQTGQSTAELKGVQRETMDSARIPIYREELVVDKKRIKEGNGGVTLRKTVSTSEAQKPVELKREEYKVTRSEANGDEKPAADVFQDQEIYIPLTREEPVVEVRTFVSEQVRLKKQVETDQHTIRENVRRETIEIGKEAQADQPEK